MKIVGFLFRRIVSKETFLQIFFHDFFICSAYFDCGPYPTFGIGARMLKQMSSPYTVAG